MGCNRPVSTIQTIIFVVMFAGPVAAQTAGAPESQVDILKHDESSSTLLALNQNDSAPDGEPTSPAETEVKEPEPLLWKGFLYGDPHFRDKPRPVGSPLYFEDPFINSDARLVYLYH